MTDNPTGDPAIGISIQTQFHDRCQVVLQTHIARDDGDIDPLLDRIMKAVNRQVAIYELEDAKLKLKKEEADLEDAMKRLNQYEITVRSEYASTERGQDDATNGRDRFEWMGQWKANHDNHLINIDGHQKHIVYFRDRIAELENKIGR